MQRKISYENFCCLVPTAHGVDAENQKVIIRNSCIYPFLFSAIDLKNFNSSHVPTKYIVKYLFYIYFAVEVSFF